MTVCEQAQGIAYRNHHFLYMIKGSFIQSVCELFTMAGKRIHLTPGHYVGIEEEEDDGIPFEEKMEKLSTQYFELQAKSRALDEKISRNLLDLGFGK